MKKIYNYTFQLVCVYIMVLSLFSISDIEIKVNHYGINTQNLNQEKVVESSKLVDNTRDDLEEENGSINEIVDEKTESDTTNTILQEESEVVVEEKPSQPAVNIVDTSSFAVLSQETVNISHYGHDCYGCTTGLTASGYYVGDGRIYYNDNTFGSVRIVAADRKYPLGTIVRLDYYGSTITAIVLDRGGAIGDGKRFQIDLLMPNEQEANQLGIVQATKLEVLRLGY